MRAGLPNGTSCPQEHALAKVRAFPSVFGVRESPFSLLPALAGSRFRLAGKHLAFSQVRWVSEMRVVFGSGGWPNGMEVGFTMVSALAGCHLVTDNLFVVTP